MKSLMAEIMGKEGGVCQGRGGSQHLCNGRFFSNGIQAGGLPIAVGYAYQVKKANTGGVVVAQVGDGTFGQGVFYEALNLASLYSLPILLVVEHNGYAVFTP